MERKQCIFTLLMSAYIFFVFSCILLSIGLTNFNMVNYHGCYLIEYPVLSIATIVNMCVGLLYTTIFIRNQSNHTCKRYNNVLKLYLYNSSLIQFRPFHNIQWGCCWTTLGRGGLHQWQGWWLGGSRTCKDKCKVV